MLSVGVSSSSARSATVQLEKMLEGMRRRRLPIRHIRAALDTAVKKDPRPTEEHAETAQTTNAPQGSENDVRRIAAACIACSALPLADALHPLRKTFLCVCVMISE